MCSRYTTGPSVGYGLTQGPTSLAVTSVGGRIPIRERAIGLTRSPSAVGRLPRLPEPLDIVMIKERICAQDRNVEFLCLRHQSPVEGIAMVPWE